MKKYFKNKTLLIIAGAILMFAASSFVYIQNRSKEATDSGLPGVGSVTGVNYSEPTEYEKQQAEEHKQTLGNPEDTQPTQPTPEKKSVSVTVSSAGQSGSEIEVYSFISGVIEDGGTCVATFTKDNSSLEKSTKGLQDATTTICAPIRFSSTELSSGTWTVVLQYSSPTSSGISNLVTFKVQ